MNSDQSLFNLIGQYLETVQVIQLATSHDNQPWVCSVHFATDDKLNIYWISNPFRRHSQEIAENNKISAAVAISFPEHPVVGISIEGDAEIVTTEDAINVYAKRFALSDEFKIKLINGQADEKIYCLTPRLYVLFDEEKYPDSPRQELNLN